MNKIVIVRAVLSLALVYAIYGETGIWTGILAFLVLLSFELTAFLLRKLRKDLKAHIESDGL